MEHQDRRRSHDADIAVLKVEMAAVKTGMGELQRDVRSLLDLVNQTKGGWKTIILVAGAAGTMGAFMAKILPFVGALPK